MLAHKGVSYQGWSMDFALGKAEADRIARRYYANDNHRYYVRPRRLSFLEPIYLIGVGCGAVLGGAAGFFVWRLWSYLG